MHVCFRPRRTCWTSCSRWCEAKMNVTGVGVTSSLVVQSLGDMRSTLADLQRQLGTGKRSTTYAGLGIDRGLAVGLRGKLSAIAGYGDTVTQLGVRISLASTALGRI